jgi:hypothetical protein
MWRRAAKSQRLLVNARPACAPGRVDATFGGARHDDKATSHGDFPEAVILLVAERFGRHALQVEPDRAQLSSVIERKIFKHEVDVGAIGFCHRASRARNPPRPSHAFWRKFDAGGNPGGPRAPADHP